MNVLRKIKHARWEVNQERYKTEEEESAEKLDYAGRVAEVSKRQQVPEHLEQNHI